MKLIYLTICCTYSTYSEQHITQHFIHWGQLEHTLLYVESTNKNIIMH